MKTRFLESPILIGMAMTFGFGTPILTRTADRVLHRRGASSADAVNRNFAVVGTHFEHVIQRADDEWIVVDDRHGEEG